MTPEEFRDRMQVICDDTSQDAEGHHMDADELMCKLLRELGYGEGVDIFVQSERWYA